MKGYSINELELARGVDLLEEELKVEKNEVKRRS